MKKSLAMLLVLALVLSLLAACGSAAETTASSAVSAEDTGETSVSAEAPEAAAPADAEVPEETAEDTASAEEPAEEVTAEIPPLEVTLPLDDTATFTIWDLFPPPLVGFMEGPWDCAAIELLEEATNVKLEFTSNSTETASELFNLMVASGNYCDLINGVADYYTSGPDAAITDEVIIDLSDMAATMPNYQRLVAEIPEADERTSGGNMYQFPMIVTEQFSDMVRGPATRGDWLDEQGLEAPETLDEFHEMLKTFHNAYGGGTYLMDASGFDNTIGNGFGVIYGFFQIDGEVKYGPLEDGFKEYVEYAHTLFVEELLAPDFYALFGPPTDMISSGTVGVFAADVGMWSMFTSGIDTPNYRTVGFLPPVKTAGEKTHFAQETSLAENAISVSTACEDLDLMAAYIDYMYSDEFAIAANFGKEGEGFNYGEDGKPHLSDLVLNNTETITSFAVKKYTLFTPLPHQDIQTRFMDAYDDYQLDTILAWTDAADSAWSLPRTFSLSENDNVAAAAIMSDVETSVDESLLGFITGSISLDTYDSFIEGIKAMGVQDAIDIYQNALDEYYANNG